MFVYLLMSKIKSTIGKNVKRYGEKLCISKDKLSKSAGITSYTITKTESGATPDPRIETVKKIVAASGISVDESLKP